MNFNEFINELIEIINNKLNGEAVAFEKNVIKNNDIHLCGLSFKKEGANALPTVYVENFYSQYQSGADMNDIADSIIEIYESNQLDEGFDADFFKSYDEVAPNLFAKLINLNKNEELLKYTPYRQYLDLAIVAYCRIENVQFGFASILIRREHLNMWGVSEDELIDCALKNTREKMEYQICGIDEVIREIDGDLDIPELDKNNAYMLVLSNKERLFGAIFMAYPDILREIYERTHDKYLILPSSIHEIIVLMGEHDKSIDEINEMIREINDFSVSKEEVLSEHAYQYSHDAQVLIF